MEKIRSRRLRKYEAQAEALAPDQPRAGEPELECFSPFGPMIARLRVPDDLVRRVNRHADGCLEDRRGGELLLPESLVASGGKQRFAKSLISFEPRVGDFYVFPGWLLHVAEPFKGRGERRSMAFNAFVQGGD